MQDLAGHTELMDIDEHIVALQHEGGLLAAAAGRRGLGAPVPACSGWQVRDLLRHLGYVHRWAAGYVGQARRTMVKEPPESEIIRAGPADEKLLRWFQDGLAELAGVLRAADPGLVCWTFFDAPTPLAFWARRQAHETAIHRADAAGVAGLTVAREGADGQIVAREGAGGQTAAPEVATAVTPFPAGFAADGIDELLTGFAPRARFRAGADQGGTVRSLMVQATDTGDEWLTEIGARITAHRGTGGARVAQCTLAGRASDLYLLLWNRLPDPGSVTVSGDSSVLELWRARVRVTWN
jgi:uncharacterized protein (TIGR03083 family)